MKGLKRGIMALITGQLITLYRKDEQLQQEVKQASGFDKVKALIHGLVNFNKEIIDDIQHIDIQKQKIQAKSRIQTQKIKIEEQIELLRVDAQKFDADVLATKIDDMTHRIQDFATQASHKIEELTLDTPVGDIISQLKNKLKNLGTAPETQEK